MISMKNKVSDSEKHDIRMETLLYYRRIYGWGCTGHRHESDIDLEKMVLRVSDHKIKMLEYQRSL